MQKVPETTSKDIRDYLLGNVPDDKRAELEARLLNDDRLFEDLLISENELVDEYFAGRLTQPEKQQFESHFLAAPERHTKFRFGRVLAQYLDQHDEQDSATEESEVLPQPFVPVIGRPGSSFQWLFSPAFVGVSLAVVTLFVASAIYFWWSQKVGNLESGQQVAVVSLMPGAQRSSGSTQKVEITPDVGKLQLELRLASIDFRGYQAELLNEGATVRVIEGLRPSTKNGEHSVVLVMNPLDPGDYQVKLSGVSDSGQLQTLNAYNFRVSTP